MTSQSLTFASSPFWPIAIGFFGLGTGYFIWGGQVLFGYPKASPEVDRTMACGVSGCRVFANSSQAYISWWG
jgi:hypothetical protein